MKINESGMDRVIRAVLGIILLVVYIAAPSLGGLGIVLAVLGAVALLTGIVGFCPLYKLLNISTNKS